MIKVLDKAFGILEEIATASPQPLGPLELAERLGLNRATCSRILKILLDEGYIIQISRQAGYTAGPRMLTLGNMVKYRPRLLKQAKPAIDACAVKIGQSVLLAELHLEERYILYHRNCNPRLNIELRQLAYRDLFYTATGLVLVAYQPREVQQKLFAESSSRLPELDDFSQAEKVFEQIRQNREYIRDKYQTSQGIVAFPVFENGQMTASLGGSVPASEFIGEYRTEVIETVRQTAREISESLAVLHSIG